MKETEDSEKVLSVMDNDFRDGIDLLHLLISKKISLHRYSDFMKWRFGPGYQFLSFQQIIKSATHKMYGETLAQKMAPQISMVRLPSGRSAPLVIFNAEAMIYDLISDLGITCRKNMIFDNTSVNPFQLRENEYFADIDSSTYYTETLKSANINPEEDVLCPVVLYIDELKLDSFGKLSLEPVVMSLMIYNRSTRNLSKSWRVIGYMPNFGSMFGRKSYTADEKATDYHFCLKNILNGIRELQQNRNGHRWTFSFTDEGGNVTNHTRNLHFPLAYVIGDAKGNDLLCGRYGSHHNTKCVGRDCDALTATCDDPSVRCNFLRMNDIENMTKAELAKISFRKLTNNAFSGLWFGAQPYGINGCVPAEPLHQINMGILERLPAAFFDRLSKKLLIALDRHVAFTCTYFYRQSDRSYPDLFSFTSGVSEAKRLTGREKLSRVFCIYLVLLTQEFQDEVIGSMGRVSHQDDDDEDNDNTTEIDREEYNTWVNVFEETLLLTSWIYLAEHPKVFFRGGRNSVAAMRLAQFVNMYRQSAPRAKGMGLKIVKFHQLLHLWWIIKLYGSLLNVDGARGESNAIVLTKQPGLHTQMRHILLNLQTASERFKRDIILKSYKALHNIDDDDDNDDDDDDDSNTNQESDDDNRGEPNGSRFNVVFDYENKCIITKWSSPKMKSKACHFPQLISGSVFEHLSFYNGGHPGKRIHKVDGFTEVKLRQSNATVDNNTASSNVHIIRACPSFRSSRPWFDWAIIKWSCGDNDIDTPERYIEAQVLMMLDMTTIKYEDCPPSTTNNQLICDTPHDLIVPEQVAFVHSSKGGRYKKDTSSTGRKSSIAFWSTMESNYQMVDLESIDKPCFVIVDKFDGPNGDKFVAGHATNIISLLPKPMWSNKFLNYDDPNLMEEARTRTDDTVQDEDLKPYET